MLDLEFFEKVQVFLLEGLLCMMLFLIQNVVVHISDLRMTVRKSPVTFLPVEPALDPCVIVDEICGIIFDISHQIRYRHCRFQPDKYMHMIFHTVNNDRFLSLVFDDPCHVFEHFITPFFLEEILASLHGENDLNIDLGICSSHACSFS